MSRLILYDTGNFRDYPVGGQVTSIQNFLRYLAEAYPQHVQDVLLVGVSCETSSVGRIQTVETGGARFSFLAVTQAETDLGKVRRSLRLEYVKGLWKYRKLIGIRKEDCNYIHTPEAFGAVRLIRPGAVCYVFSHGTYLDMWKRVRFFKKAPIVRKLFQGFLMHVIRRSTAVFVLEKETLEAYSRYNPHVIQVGNSIVCQPYRERRLHADAVRFLYAGRLSAVKNVGPIIEAVRDYHRDCSLNILGDGEERESLERLAAGCDRIHFLGAVRPDEVQQAMRESDVLVMNSTFEGIPMTILEALNCKLPIVVRNLEEYQGIVSDYCLLCEDVDGFDREINRLCRDSAYYEEARAKSAAGRDYYSTQNVAKMWDQFYSGLTKKVRSKKLSCDKGGVAR